MPKVFFKLTFSMLITTATGLIWSDNMGLTGVSMLYLLLVVAVAYFYSTLLALTVSTSNFLLLNFFFVEPKLTFRVADVASWASLIGFLSYRL